MVIAENDSERTRAADYNAVKRALDGDTDAFAELVDRYQNMVYNLAFQSLRNPDDAFDASQDVFLKVYKALKSFRGDSKFSTWIYSIAQNTIRDYIRARSRRITPLSLSDYGDGDSGGGEVRQLDIPDSDPKSSPAEVYERKERDEAVREAISSLSETHREIVVMRDIEGCSYEQISERLGLELGTVKSRLNRARLAVKDYLVKRNIL
jgi:RNA polymerase sigma factor, sigma-70 family